jgi:hypothetical protein
MPDPNTFDPVAEFQKAYPAANLDENRIRASLQDPANFRAAFPAYSHLNDATITTNMKQFAPGGAAQKATAAARVAQPTQFEEESKARGDSATPWTDVAKGVGEGLLRPVSGVAGLINKIPHVGETLAPSQGVKALQNVSTPVTPGEKLGAHEADVATTLIPIAGEAGEARAAGKLLPYAKKLATGAIGSMVGGEAGKYVGGHVGGELGADIGEGLGALGGGLAGGGAFGEKYRKIGNPSELPYFGKFLPDLVEDKGFVPMGPTRVNDSHIAELNKPPVPAVAETPFHLTSPAAAREAPVQTGFNFPGQEAPAEIPSVAKAPRDPLRSQLQQVGDLVKQGAGTPEMPTLQPGVPIGQQPRSVGAAAPSGFPRVGEAPLNAGGKVTFRREPIIKTVGGLEEGPGRAVAPEKVPAALGNEIDRAMKVEPDDVAKWRQGLQTKYPDREHRQLVHSEGEELADTLGNNRELLTKIHDLKNPDVRQLAINSGENLVRDDGSPIMVNNRAADVKGETSDSRILKFNRLIDAGLDPQTIANKTLPGDIPRPSMFKWLLKKGVKPEEMYDLAHKPMEEAIAGKPGPIRSQPWTKPGEKTGD